MPPPGQASQASQACRPCRTLKRKCPRELPSCSLCLRLGKSCTYSAPTDQHTNQLPSADGPPLSNEFPSKLLHTSQGSRIEQGHVRFPARFYLDSESWTPLASDEFEPAIPTPIDILDLLGSTSQIHAIIHDYFSIIQSWLPILSWKRINRAIDKFRPARDAGFALLLLCMKLVVTTPPDLDMPTEYNLYNAAKAYQFTLENRSFVSLQLLQAGVLISLYEVGHAIFPAAYLSVGHVTRLGMSMALHDRKHATPLFQDPDTWTAREEERRTWWAIGILDRHIHLGTSGVPLMTAEPEEGALLPCPESSWDQGSIGPNEPLFTSTLYSASNVGTFANTCQAYHILGHVIRHINDYRTAKLDIHYRLSEAVNLHNALVALKTHLCERDQPDMTALAACCAARLKLYNIYGCNEHMTTVQGHVAEQTQLQQVAIEGLREVTVHSVAYISKSILGMETGEKISTAMNPLICHCLYQAVGELDWFIKEEESEDLREQWRTTMAALKVIGGRWGCANEYLNLCEG